MWKIQVILTWNDWQDWAINFRPLPSTPTFKVWHVSCPLWALGIYCWKGEKPFHQCPRDPMIPPHPFQLWWERVLGGVKRW